MKKKIAVLIGLMMVLTLALAACGGGSGGESGGEDLSDSKYVGTWVVDTLSFAGETGEAETNFTLNLNGDGTGTLIGTNEDGTEDVSNLTWSLTDGGFKTKGDAKMDFKDDGDAIVAKILGVEMRMVKAGEGEGEEVVDLVDGAAYGYGGDDPIEAACYAYMAETVSKDYEAAEYSIPTVNIVHEDLTQEDEYLVYGDFWIENYNGDDDVLKCVSGGNYPGCMHVSKDDYTVTAFDVVADGGNFDASAKEIFGENYDSFVTEHGDDESNKERRKVTVSDYVNLNNLGFKYYQDEGWDPVELYHAPGEE